MPSRTADQLHGQFTLRRSDPVAPVPAGWIADTLGGFTLARHPTLPAYPIRCDGKHIGWLLGIAAGPDSTLVDSELVVPSIAQLEETIYRYGGRFATVVITPGFARFYVDPCASLGAVYGYDGAGVGSTSTALSLGDDAYFARKAAEPTPIVNTFPPAGLTDDLEFGRVMPNHYLDLHTSQTVRHWPKAKIIRDTDANAPKHIAGIVKHLKSVVDAVAGKYHIYCGLTAGRDSRMILAAARDAVKNITFITFRFKPGGYNKAKVVDIHIAQKLSQKLGLKHEEFELRDPPQEMKDEFQWRTGWHTHWGRAVDHYDALLKLDLKSVFMTGFAGEIGRASYWGWGDALKEELTPKVLLERLSLPTTPANLAAMKLWREALGDQDYYAICDLLYLEHRAGTWAGPGMYGYAPFVATLTPFAHRGVIEEMYALPVDFRAKQQMAIDVVKHGWPEAAAFPFQKYTGWLGFKAKASEQATKWKQHFRNKLGGLKRRIVK